MNKHTFGPWRLEKHPVKNCPDRVQYRIEGFGRTIALVFHKSSREDRVERNEADAYLITAAPDLLEALQAAQMFIRNGIALGFIKMPDANTPDPAHRVLPLIDAVLTKATGRLK